MKKQLAEVQEELISVVIVTDLLIRPLLALQGVLLTRLLQGAHLVEALLKVVMEGVAVINHHVAGAALQEVLQHEAVAEVLLSRLQEAVADVLLPGLQDQEVLLQKAEEVEVSNFC